MNVAKFLPMQPPSVTAQMHRISARRDGRPLIYDSPALADARVKLMAHLARHQPAQPLKPPLLLHTKWCYDRKGTRHKNGEYKATRPDTDNAVKLFKDCMAALGYMRDDAHVACELTEKFWADVPGIWFELTELSPEVTADAPQP